MKRLIFLLVAMFSCENYALTTLYEGKESISSYRYLRLSPNNSFQSKTVNNEPGKMPGLPAKSELKSGEFGSYRLSECQKLSVPFYVVGADKLSRQWLETHKVHLQKIHALGFITNIDSQSTLSDIENTTSTNLVPTKVDGLAQVVNAPSYPFLTNGCEVWQ
jgi:integrating conjugative element protein (TIGR03765 family)